MIYTDGVHIVSDKSVVELHEYCKTIGIKRCWFHSGSRFPHYDVPKHRKGEVFPNAKVVTPRDIVMLLSKYRLCPACNGTGTIHQNCILR